MEPSSRVCKAEHLQGLERKQSETGKYTLCPGMRRWRSQRVYSYLYAYDSQKNIAHKFHKRFRMGEEVGRGRGMMMVVHVRFVTLWRAGTQWHALAVAFGLMRSAIIGASRRLGGSVMLV